MENVEIAWAAGLFEGEGCVSIAQRSGGQPVLALSTTDLDVLERFAAIVGCGYIGDKGRWYTDRGYKPQWRWQTKSFADVRRVIALFRPFMGVRRGEKMDAVLALLADKPMLRSEACSRAALAARKRTHCKRGHEFTPENTYVYSNGWRRCKTCHRENERAGRNI